MRYIKLTQGKKTIVDDKNFEWLSRWKWCLGRGKYAYRRKYMGRINGKWQFESIYMHRLINKTPEGFETDHINHNKLDNRQENLRTVTHQQNSMNISFKRKDNTSGTRGVWFDKERNKWAVEIMLNQKKIHIGRYAELEEAKKQRLTAETTYFKEYAPLAFK